tara:strand:- start:187 stop:1125 length:939 start_codon:yes stop_codon:yes gene_type:complete
MLYTGNVNRLIFWFIIPLILVSYIAFRILEWQYFDDGRRLEIAKQHLINLTKQNDINCLILGGSNAVFGLSAEQMSRDDDLNCYNLSLLNEGFSDLAYFEFINSIPINKMEITYIFYSSMISFNLNGAAERIRAAEDKIGISGVEGFQLLGVSFIKYLTNLLVHKPFFSSNRNYPNPTLSGDFNFEKYDGCNFATNRPDVNQAWSLSDLTWNENKLFTKLLDERLLNIRNLFQNAKVYFVLPSSFQKKLSDKEKTDYSKSLQESLAHQPIVYIEQSQFLNSNLVCDALHHANELGRKVRTSELLTLMHAHND